jgi:hypothetical protein
MTFHRSTRRALALSLALPVLAAPAAVAQPLDSGPYPTHTEQQVLASRGLGAPTSVRAAVPPVRSANDGFDWGDAGIGAAAAGGLVLVGIGGLGLASRTRIRLAR